MKELRALYQVIRRIEFTPFLRIQPRRSQSTLCCCAGLQGLKQGR